MAGSSFNLMTAFVTLKERGVQTVMGSIGRIRNSTQRASKGFGGMGAAMSMALKVGARFTIIAGGLMAVGRAAKNLIGWLGRVSMQLATLASDAEETQNKFNATFGGQAEKAEEFVDRFSAAIGRSKTDVREGMSAYQAFFKGLDFGEKPATDLSITLQRLASDFGSFHNLSEQESMQRFISALSGSGEVLDRFGVNIKSAALDQQLLAMGFPKVTKGATEQQKALARLSIIHKSMTAQGAVGDAQKTAGGFANQMKALQGSFKDAGVALGQLFIPAMQRMGGALSAASTWIQQNQATLQQWGASIGEVVGKATAPFRNFFKLLTVNSDVAWQYAWVQVKTFGDRVMDLFVMLGRVAQNFFTEAVGAAGTFATHLPNIIKGAFTGEGQSALALALADSMSDVNLMQGVTEGLGKDRAGTTAAKNKLQETLEDAGFSSLEEALEGSVEKLPDLDQQAFGNVMAGAAEGLAAGADAKKQQRKGQMQSIDFIAAASLQSKVQKDVSRKEDKQLKEQKRTADAVEQIANDGVKLADQPAVAWA